MANVLSQLCGDVYGAQVVLVNFVFCQAVFYARGFQHPYRIGFVHRNRCVNKLGEFIIIFLLIPLVYVFSLWSMFSFSNIRSYLQWQRHARTKQGHRVHSPFLYSLIANSLHKKIEGDWVLKVEDYRRKLLGDKTVVDVKDLGAGSQFDKNPARRICSIVRHSSTSARDGRFLFNLASAMQCRSILELGTNMGIGTLYLANSTSCERVITIEGCPKLSEMAQSVFAKLGMSNIKVVNADFSDALPKALSELPTLDFVFLDGNHRYQPTLDYFGQCLPYVNNDTVFVVDDIHKNAEMELAWKELSDNQNVTLSLDLYTMGVLFFRRQLSKQTVCLRY